MRLSVVVRVNPMSIEAFKHIGIVNSLIFTIIKSCERNAETVLIVPQTDIRIEREGLVDTSVDSRTHQSVMDLEVLELQGDLTGIHDIHRVEEGQSMRSSEHESAVRKAA